MSPTLKNTNLPWLIQTYFSNPSRQKRLKAGEVVMEQGGFNDRLYLVRSGTLAAFVKKPDGGQFKLYQATQNMFVGVYSFFSRTHKSSATVLAEEASEVAYIDHHQKVINRNMGYCLFEQFMPVVVTYLALREREEQLAAFEKEKAISKLIESEKLASLGQMAAGIAHELNNAISVLGRNTHWLKERIIELFDSAATSKMIFLKHGLQQGRLLASRQVREQTRVFEKQFSLPTPIARKLAETGIQPEILQQFLADFQTQAEKWHHFWEIGATLHDMSLAAEHASHVVRSVKNLASTQNGMESNLDVNNTISEALALLSSPLRKVNLKLLLNPLPPMVASKGSLVQVWTNLINNALESMHKQPNQQLLIESKQQNDYIMVKIQDNGPGIPPEHINKIFQPNFTTKEKGLDFGLGLGLTIVARIIDSYHGDISVTSVKGKTIFTVKLPV